MDSGSAVFAVLGRDHLAAQQQAGDLHAVADAKNRHAQVVDLSRDAGRTVTVHRRRTARQDDPRGVQRTNAIQRKIEGVDLEIEDEDDLLG
jgi:hypothetical protein